MLLKNSSLILVALVIVTGQVYATAPEWKVVNGRHFLVHHLDNAALAESVAGKAEECYDRIAADLGFAKFDNFWLWENRVKIFIYPSRERFAKETGAPEWAMGRAVASRREISTFQGDESFMDSVLPHEMTHLLVRDFIGFKKDDIPLWLNEGLAQWEEPAKRQRLVRIARRLVAGNASIPLARLMLIDVPKLLADGKAPEFYAQSVSLVGFMIEKQGSERFRVFCGQVRDGKTMDEALRFAYPGSISNIADLEKAWRIYLMEQQEAGQ